MVSKLWRIWKRVIKYHSVPDSDVLYGPEFVVDKCFIDGIQDIPTLSYLEIIFIRMEP